MILLEIQNTLKTFSHMRMIQQLFNLEYDTANE